MKETLWKELESLGHEVYEQGSITDSEAYPDHFFTIWNDETTSEYYDNVEKQCIWEFTIDFYSIDPRFAVNGILEAKRLLISKGWIVPGKGEDIYSDSKSHSGRSIKARIIEKEKKNV